MKKKELLKEAEAIKIKCNSLLENAPQAMSNVSSIISVLRAITKLIEQIEQTN